MRSMTLPEELVSRFGMEAHVENGSYIEKHYVSAEPGRAASGSIYYYVAPEELTKFHSIDCDEYWCYVAGSPLEVWQISTEGAVSSSMLGTEAGCEPLLYIKKGVKFASRHMKKESEGTFLICITVPRFSPEGFTLYEDDFIREAYPAAAPFFSRPCGE